MPAPALLAVPQLDATIPSTIVPGRRASVGAQLTRMLVDAGFVGRADLSGSWDDPTAIAEASVRRWLRRQLGPMHCFAPSFIVGPEGLEGSESYLHVVWGVGDYLAPWVVGAGLQRLEDHTPGLAQAVLSILDQKSGPVCPVFSPWDARDHAQFLYWMGEEDERAYLEEYSADEAERADMRDSMVTAAMFEQAFPPWLRGRKKSRVRTQWLRSVVVTTRDAFVRSVVTVALRLQSIRRPFRYGIELFGDFVGFAAVLSWRADDLTVRVFDDLYNTAHEGECFSAVGDEHFEWDDVPALLAWKRNMHAHLRIMRLVDELIWRLSQVSWDEEEGP